MRLLMLPAVAAALLLAGCGYSNEPPPARSPVVVPPAPLPRPEVVQSAAECSQPDVTYFFANDQAPGDLNGVYDKWETVAP